MKTAAVIVTYNRKDLLMENLDALTRQSRSLDSIIIIDNASTDGTEETLRNRGYFNKLPIDYVSMNHNSGGAGGFSKGVQYAYEKGFDWIILMDDDGKPYNSDTIEILMSTGEYIYRKKNKKVMINSLVTFNGKDLSFCLGYNVDEIENAQRANNLLMDSINPFNCTLISKDLVSEIGVPRADFFISCDEREYNARANRYGAFIATVPTSVYIHPKARDEVKILNGRKYETFNSLLKEYYYTRNSIVKDSENVIILKKIVRTLRIMKSRVIAIIYFETNKTNRLKMINKAFWDAIFGKMGKRM